MARKSTLFKLKSYLSRPKMCWFSWFCSEFTPYTSRAMVPFKRTIKNTFLSIIIEDEGNGVNRLKDKFEVGSVGQSHIIHRPITVTWGAASFWLVRSCSSKWTEQLPSLSVTTFPIPKSAFLAILAIFWPLWAWSRTINSETTTTRTGLH